MTRIRIAAGALFLLWLPALAAAGQINLRWNACWGDGGIMNKLFACNTNAGTNTLVASFIPPQDVHQATSLDAAIDLAVAGGSVPDWWRFRASGSCRASSLNTSPAPPATAVACLDWASGAGFAAVTAYTVGFLGPSSAHISVSSLPVPSIPAELTGGQEYFAFSLLINNLKTVGTGACAGCDLGACIGLKAIQLNVSSPVGTVTLFPSASDDRLATWQGGAGVVFEKFAGYIICPLATPTRNSTWSAVKSLYR